MLPWSVHDRAIGVLFIRMSVGGMTQCKNVKYLAILSGPAAPIVAIRFKPIAELPIAIKMLQTEVVECEPEKRFEATGGNGNIRRSRA